MKNLVQLPHRILFNIFSDYLRFFTASCDCFSSTIGRTLASVRKIKPIVTSAPVFKSTERAERRKEVPSSQFFMCDSSAPYYAQLECISVFFLNICISFSSSQS